MGFAVQVVGRHALRSHGSLGGSDQDARHLSVRLLHLRDILTYLEHIGVSCYRLPPTLLPPASTLDHRAMQGALAQISACREQLEFLAHQIQQQGVRISMHLHGTLGCAQEMSATKGLAFLALQTMLLEALDPRRDGVLVTHVGGSVRDPLTRIRFLRRYEALPATTRGRLVVENDSWGWSLGQLLQLHQECGIPVVFDVLHHQLSNPEQISLPLALGLSLATWPPHLRPKVHLSSARSEAHLIAGEQWRVLPPRPGQHADFVLVTDLLRLLEAARGLPPFDLMIEAKAGDLALLRLRSEVARCAPHLATMLG